VLRATIYGRKRFSRSNNEGSLDSKNKRINGPPLLNFEFSQELEREKRSVLRIFRLNSLLCAFPLLEVSNHLVISSNTYLRLLSLIITYHLPFLFLYHLPRFLVLPCSSRCPPVMLCSFEIHPKNNNSLIKSLFLFINFLRLRRSRATWLLLYCGLRMLRKLTDLPGKRPLFLARDHYRGEIIIF